MSIPLNEDFRLSNPCFILESSGRYVVISETILTCGSKHIPANPNAIIRISRKCLYFTKNVESPAGFPVKFIDIFKFAL
jgi:hypothetical protein